MTDRQRTEQERRVREARLELARRRTNWTELPETRLVPRGPFVVDAETDLVYALRRGVVFEPGKAVTGYLPDHVPMTFFVDRGDNIVFLEQSADGREWSEIVARRARTSTT